MMEIRKKHIFESDEPNSSGKIPGYTMREQ
jgi:hypothetical protein